jgi:hypothetical protein
VLTWVWFGFDRERLYVRMDGVRPFAELLAEGYTFSVTFLRPEGLRFEVRAASGQPVGRFWRRPTQAPGWSEQEPGASRVAAGSVLEIEMTFVELGLSAKTPGAAFVIAVNDSRGNEIERHPAHRPIEVPAGELRFEASMWSV